MEEKVAPTFFPNIFLSRKHINIATLCITTNISKNHVDTIFGKLESIVIIFDLVLESFRSYPYVRHTLGYDDCRKRPRGMTMHALFCNMAGYKIES